MPFSTHSLDILADDRLPALQAFRSSSLCTLGLAVQTPCVPILLDVAHTFLERISTLSAEEVSEMPVLAQCNRMLTDDRCLTMPASGGEEFMPVKMTVVSKSLIAILSNSLALNLWELLSLGTSLDPVEALGSVDLRLRTDFEGFESSSASETDEALRMEAFGGSTECYHTSFDG